MAVDYRRYLAENVLNERRVVCMINIHAIFEDTNIGPGYVSTPQSSFESPQRSRKAVS